MSMDVEKAPSNRSHCALCQKTIKLGETRLKVMENTGAYLYTKYYCKACGKKHLEKEGDAIQELYKRIEKRLEE